jgi:hypothetical protein
MSTIRIPSATIHFALQPSLEQRAGLRLPRITQCLKLGSRASCSWARTPASRCKKVPSSLRNSSILQVARLERFSTSIVQRSRLEDSTSAPKTPQVGRVYIGCIMYIQKSCQCAKSAPTNICTSRYCIFTSESSSCAMHELPIHRCKYIHCEKTYYVACIL